LSSVDVIACEDTRITSRLLARHNIKTPLTLYHEHNATRAAPKLIRQLLSGRSVALVSDAGTPLISDPGYKLVNQTKKAEIAVFVSPGACSPIAALIASGLPTDRFLFAGFLPSRQISRRKTLEELAGIKASLILLESPNRLARCLSDMAAIFGPRQAAVARELTKRYEELVTGTLEDLAARYKAAPPPKGEVVLVIGPPDSTMSNKLSSTNLDKELRQALETMSVRDAAREVSNLTKLPRQAIYRRALELTNEERS
jgi:16S rRNA (cytidine1402-2'-O)-methyltransferase